ncbi:MAG: hypothetical protein ABUS49_11885 [Acidobacteriota bacterium]
MLNPPSGRALNRRKILQTFSEAGLLLVSTSRAFGASDFWNKKAASEWTGDELEQLKTRSPWARKTRAELRGGAGGGRDGESSMDRSGSRGTFGGMSGADSNGISDSGGGRGGGRGGRGGGESGGGGGAAAPQGPEVIVRWENAKPILEATRIKLPPDLENHYAISVTGLPPQLLAMMLAGGGRGRGRGRNGGNPPETPETPQAPEDPAARQKAMVARLLHSVTLSAKGRDPEAADLIRQTNNNETLIFGFPKEGLPLAAGDKDVEFLMKLGPLTLKAKFEPKDMKYKGELSV